MAHLPPLIQDLAVILTMAAVVLLIFRMFNQPAVLGYLVAGFLVGPHVPIFPGVIDPEGVKVWAEIGVIVLLFTIGLEFSFRKLMHTGRTAIGTGLFEIVCMISFGLLTGLALGWSLMDSIFLGSVLSISSTTIIAKSLSDSGQMKRSFVPLVMGVLIVEDLVAVLLMVFLATFAVSKTLEGSALLMSTGRLTFFLILWVVLGTLLIPKIIRRISKYLSDEVSLVVGLGLCFVMVVIATSAGFSAALGAFVMGSILAETSSGPRIEHLLRPIRDLFGAVFFVSMGMLVDPATLIANPGAILAISFITIFGKTFTTAIGAIVSGESVTRSLQAGLCLAQIGEFSFIIAALGVSLNVVGDHLPAVTVAVSAITTFTTPYFIKNSTAWSQFAENRIPAGLRMKLESYRIALRDRQAPGIVAELLKRLGAKIIINSVMIIAVAWAGERFLRPIFEPAWGAFGHGLTLLAVLFLSAPFFWGLTAGHVDWPERLSGARSVARILTALRIAIGSVLFLFVLSRFLSLATSSGVLLAAVASIPLWGRRFAQRAYQSFEQELQQRFEDPPNQGPARPRLAPWDATLIEFTASPHSNLVGSTLSEVGFKERFGVTVAMVERGARRILAPGRDHRVLPGDKVYLIGTDAQLERAGKALSGDDRGSEVDTTEYGLASLTLGPDAIYVGRPIRDSGLRERINGLIVGLERDGQRVLNPDSGLILKNADLLWVVGDLDKISSLRDEAIAPRT